MYSIHCSAEQQNFFKCHLPSRSCCIIFSLSGNKNRAAERERKKKYSCNIYYTVHGVRVLKNENTAHNPITTTGDTPKGCYNFITKQYFGAFWFIFRVCFFLCWPPFAITLFRAKNEEEEGKIGKSQRKSIIEQYQQKWKRYGPNLNLF